MMEKMIKNLQKKSNKKGFTLVEIIVVLVILAILAAIAIPSVMGYVNDAKNSKYIQEARSIYLVVQTEEARIRAEKNDKNYALSTAEYNTIASTAVEKTTLQGISISTVAENGDVKAHYHFEWTSDGSTRKANVFTNDKVEIEK